MLVCTDNMYEPDPETFYPTRVIILILIQASVCVALKYVNAPIHLPTYLPAMVHNIT